jgi:hypothetical protein
MGYIAAVRAIACSQSVPRQLGLPFIVTTDVACLV